MIILHIAIAIVGGALVSAAFYYLTVGIPHIIRRKIK